MAGAPSRTITLSPEQHTALLSRLKAPNTCGLERRRVTALLMSHSGNNIQTIAKSRVLSEKSVSGLLNRFATLGVEAVTERPHLGRQRSVTPEMDTWILEQVRGAEQVWTAPRLCEGLESAFGVLIAPKSLVRHLHRLGLSWQRTRYVVSGAPDPAALERVEAGLPTLKRGRSRGSASST